MRSATALLAAPPPARYDDLLAPSDLQIPLPFPCSPTTIPGPTMWPGQDLTAPASLRERAGNVIQALVETLSGERPVRQMQPWMVPSVYHQLARRLAANAKSPARPPANQRARVMSVHVTMLSPDIAELAARFVHGRRSRAIAVRLETRRNHQGARMWQCTALTWG